MVFKKIMKRKNQPFEINEHDLTGMASLDFKKASFSAFGVKLVKYNADRFEPVALKIFLENGKFILTLYALDKAKQKESSEKLPVKKFKVMVKRKKFSKLIKHFAVVVSNKEFDIAQMEVINK